jgi:poly(3-hydroxybutyrate) depolymerase
MAKALAAVGVWALALAAAIGQETSGPELTAAEQDRLVAILGERPADSWKSVATLEVERARMERVQRAVEAMRSPEREPLACVESWWNVLRRRRTYEPQDAIRGKLVSRPFRGYHLSVPASYDPEQPTPLVVCLHPSGAMKGRRYIETFWRRPELRESAIVFAPDWPDEEGRPRWSARRYLDLTYRVMGDVIFQQFNIDRNRIFLDGALDGGTEAWILASNYAHLFAGLIIRAGPPPESGSVSAAADVSETVFVFRDLRNLDVLFFNHPGIWDNPVARIALLRNELEENSRRFRIVEPEGEPPAEPLAGTSDTMDPDVLDFVRTTRRDPYPRFIDWSVKERYLQRVYWVRSLDEEPSFDRRDLPNFQVFLRADENRVEIESHRILGFEVALNDLLLDLSRPVTITVNDRTVFHGRPARSLARIFANVARSGDWTDVFPWVVRVEVPPP